MLPVATLFVTLGKQVVCMFTALQKMICGREKRQWVEWIYSSLLGNSLIVVEVVCKCLKHTESSLPAVRDETPKVAPAFFSEDVWHHNESLLVICIMNTNVVIIFFLHILKSRFFACLLLSKYDLWSRKHKGRKTKIICITYICL